MRNLVQFNINKYEYGLTLTLSLNLMSDVARCDTNVEMSIFKLKQVGTSTTLPIYVYVAVE